MMHDERFIGLLMGAFGLILSNFFVLRIFFSETAGNRSLSIRKALAGFFLAGKLFFFGILMYWFQPVWEKNPLNFLIAMMLGAVLTYGVLFLAVERKKQ